MASLIDVRNMLALHGRMETGQLCAALNLSRPLLKAMLERMEAMGKARRMQEEANDCLSGSCKRCPEGKSCAREWWTLG